MRPQTAKIIPNGRSQAVRLPKEFRFEGKEVYIHREGNRVVLSPKPESWDSFFSSELQPTDDFADAMSRRSDTPAQKRDWQK